MKHLHPLAFTGNEYMPELEYHAAKLRQDAADLVAIWNRSTDAEQAAAEADLLEAIDKLNAVLRIVS